VDVTGRVRELDLRDNLLEGVIHENMSFSKLTHMESLCLESNDIYGRIPVFIGALSSLRELNLSWNRLEGKI